MDDQNQPPTPGKQGAGVPSDPLPQTNEATILQRIIADLSSLSAESRRRMVETVCTFFDIPRGRAEAVSNSPAPLPERTTSGTGFRFSEGEAATPKHFILEKAPQTDVERVACLAYYLTHFRNLPHFKTKDISDLNTEAAQRRFSNAAFSVVNATNSGYLVPSVKGCKQLSAAGEQFVQALPDRDAAREALERMRPRRAKNSKKANHATD